MSAGPLGECRVADDVAEGLSAGSIAVSSAFLTRKDVERIVFKDRVRRDVVPLRLVLLKDFPGKESVPPPTSDANGSPLSMVSDDLDVDKAAYVKLLRSELRHRSYRLCCCLVVDGRLA